MSRTVALKPRMSEKTYALSGSGVYVFEVPKSANKHDVEQAVAKQFAVTVVDVNLLNAKGKPKRTVRKGARPAAGSRSDVKKAYVTLKDGDSISVFAAAEQAQTEKDNDQ
jgi:large subunit ribosomal protein L23